MKQVLKSFSQSVLIIVILITVSVSYFGLRTLKARDDAESIAAQTNDVLGTLDDVLIGLINMETGLRGYQLTGHNQFLDHYNNGENQYKTAMAALKSLTAGNPALEQRWNKVDALEQQWVKNWAEKGIQLRKDFEAGRASNEALTSHSIAERDETLMDDMRAELEAGKQEETLLLIRQARMGKQADYQAYYVMVLGIFISLLLGLLSGFLLNRANIQKAKQIEVQHLLLEEREKERIQLARNLHDGPVQELLATTFTVQDLLHAEIGPDVSERLKAVRSSLQDVVRDLRDSTLDLRSPMLTKFGLQRAIQSDLETFQQKYPEIHVHFEEDGNPLTLPELRQATLYRIYQEVMRNILRHAQASEVHIRCQMTGEAATLTIEDNGKGFPLPEDWLSLAQQGHFGLVGIRERTEAIGGSLELTSSPRNGTRIAVTVPVGDGKIFSTKSHHPV